MLLNIVKAKTKQGDNIDFDISFPLSNELIEDKGYKFLSDVKVNGFMNYQNEELNVVAKVSFKIQAVCDNCGEEFEKDITFDLNEIFKENYNSHDEEDYLISQTCVQIDKPVEDDLILAIPTKMICKSDCKGLCQVCGKNKNYSSCQCEKILQNEEVINNPFNQLKNRR